MTFCSVAMEIPPRTPDRNIRLRKLINNTNTSSRDVDFCPLVIDRRARNSAVLMPLMVLLKAKPR
jgi:hypothetical protein